MCEIAVEVVTRAEQLLTYQRRWNELAGTRPQLRWEWLGTWAEHFCRDSLVVLVVRQGGQIIGIAPWHIEHRKYQGATICFLGNGKACTDHMTLLCEPGQEASVARAAAKWLVDSRRDNRIPWNHVELIGVDHDDDAMEEFVIAISELGCHIDQRDGLPCFGIELPNNIEEYINRRSKSGKRECRRICASLTDGRFRFVEPRTTSELEQHWSSFVELHETRRQAKGESGCFQIPNFADFFWESSCRLLEADRLRFTLMLFEDVPIASQHALVSPDRWLFYQSGMSTGHGKLKPGQMLLYHSIQQSIQEGKQYFDMMRGDEAYKSRWRAMPLSQTEIRIAAPLASTMIQQKAWQWQKAIRTWAKS